MHNATLIGHNSGAVIDRRLDELHGLSEDLAALNLDIVERADELALGAERVVITDDETAGRATAQVKLLIAAGKATADRQREVAEPFQEKLDAVRGFFRPITEKIAAAKALVLGRIDEYRRAQEELAAEARKLAQAEADKAAAEAAETDDLDAAFDAKQRAEKLAVAAVAPAAEIRSAWGHLAGSRKTWGYTVTDINAVPRQFLMVNDAMVKAHIKARQKDQAPMVVAGIEFTSSEKTVVR